MSFRNVSFAALTLAGFAVCGASAREDEDPSPAPEPSNLEKAALIGADALDVLYRLHEIKGSPNNLEDPNSWEELEKADKAGESMREMMEDLKEYGPDLIDAVKDRFNQGDEAAGRDPSSLGAEEQAGDEQAAAVEESPPDEMSYSYPAEPEFVGGHAE